MEKPILSPSFLRLFYVIGIMRYRNCIICIFPAYHQTDFLLHFIGEKYDNNG